MLPLLALYKPARYSDDKRAGQCMLLDALKNPAKKLGKMRIPAPKSSGRGKGPSGKELRDIERGK